MPMGNGSGSTEKKYKNFISLWNQDKGPAASGIFDIEAFCRVMKDQEIASAEGARAIYKAFKDNIPEEQFKMRVACWEAKDTSGKRPNFQIGYSTPPPADKTNRKPEAPADDIPF